MKNHLSSFIIFALVLMLTACNGKTSATVENTSPNGKVKIRITAERTSTFDPFKTEIKVIAYDFKEGKLIFEVMASDLNSKNVKFSWTDDSHCTITIEESDKGERKFQLIASESQVQLAEI